jgi:arylsulfatase A-like enzyme
MDGILLLWGPGVQRGAQIRGAHIVDLAPTVLAAMGVSIPDDMDGRVLTAAFGDDYFADRPITRARAESVARRSGLGYSEEDEEEIKARLRELGYVA